MVSYPAISMLHPEQCETLHLASLEILRRTGVRFHHPEALRLLEEADASISDGNLVRIPPSLVQWALDQAPPRVVLCPRASSEPALRLEGRESFFGPGSDCPNFLDPRTGEHRLYTVSDVVDSIRVVDALPEMDFCMSMGIPSDLPSPNPYRHQFALMLAHTTKPIVFVCDDRADCEAIVAMASAVAGGEAAAAGGEATVAGGEAAVSGGEVALHLNPNLLLYSEPSTPLQHSATATDKLLFMAEKGLPVVHSPAPMMGGTAPMSVAGALALGNAEVLSALVVQQLKRRGAPFVYGVQVHHMDMRTTISVYGGPEYQVARVMNAEMARYYRLPSWGNAGMTDSCALDEQAAMDVLFSVLVALLTGTNLVHDAGYMEAGLTTSPELMVLTDEAIAMARRFARGGGLDAEALALEVIHEVGPGGDFLTQRHTLRHLRDFWEPGLISRQRMPDWVGSGRKRLGARLADRTRAILDEHRPAPLPDGVQAEIDYILNSA